MQIKNTGDVAAAQSAARETPPVQTGSVILLLDMSGSMNEGNKMHQARVGALAFARQAVEKRYRVGLVAFSAWAMRILASSFDLDPWAGKLRGLAPEGGTNVALAIMQGMKDLQKCRGERILCLLTSDETCNAPAT